MDASFHDKNMCNDRWLSGLVDAMDEVESLAADDFCRSADVPAILLAQLYGRPLTNRQLSAALSSFELV
jgi:hypothetical protein